MDADFDQEFDDFSVLKRKKKKKRGRKKKSKQRIAIEGFINTNTKYQNTSEKKKRLPNAFIVMIMKISQINLKYHWVFMLT